MTLEIRFLGASDARAWSADLDAFGPLADVYFLHPYVEAWSFHVGGEARCAVAADGPCRLVVPYLMCRLPDAYGPGFDVQGAYGYGGPLAAGPDDFIARAWAAIEAAWAEQGALAAFFRLHPLLAPDQRAWVGPGWAIVDDRATVSIDLAGGPVRAFAAPSSANHRNMVARATRLGLEVTRSTLTDARARAFAALYADTMTRLGAGDEYRFDLGYFEALAAGLGDRLELFSAERGDGTTEAMALAMWGPRWGHYHLSARRDGGENCATNLLLARIADVAYELGLERVHLGGGRTPSADDSLLRFKERVATGRHVFQTARRVIRPEAYRAAMRRWEIENGAPASWFLGYRQPQRRVGSA
jgi:hypothetical protein